MADFQRIILLTSVSPILRITLNDCNDALTTHFLLFGSNDLSFDQNVKLFTAVQMFILDSGRFNNN